jgi:hypothetical protein
LVGETGWFIVFNDPAPFKYQYAIESFRVADVMGYAQQGGFCPLLSHTRKQTSADFSLKSAERLVKNDKPDRRAEHGSRNPDPLAFTP